MSEGRTRVLERDESVREVFFSRFVQHRSQTRPSARRGGPNGLPVESFRPYGCLRLRSATPRSSSALAKRRL